MKEVLGQSINETTAFSSDLITLAQIRKGSSLDTSAERSQYTSLCTEGTTSQILNISFKTNKKCRDEKPDKISLFNASVSVIKFLLGKDTEFHNDYSAERLRALLISGENESLDKIFVPGGLLFPFLTLALISYRTPCPVTIVIESYGGKSRGKHVHWDFQKTGPEEIKEIVTMIKLAENYKIPFTIRNAVKALSEKFIGKVKILSIKWGIGCDAKGSNLPNGDSSFLVCQPINIAIIDQSRRNDTDKVFKNSNQRNISTNKINFSRATRAAASNSSDSSSDNESVQADYDSARYR